MMRGRKNLFLRSLWGSLCLIIAGMLLTAAAGADQVSPEVAEKVSQVVDEVITPGMSERDKAMALHDWLIYHARYDTTFTYYGADGVLLHQTGVCQSYSEAYQLLLNKAGIESRILTGNARKYDGTLESHAWNLVKIDGIWSHVDVTWDDPVDGSGIEQAVISGMETSYYFLVTSRYIMEDHIPDEASAALINELADTSDQADEGLLPAPVKTDKRVEMPDFTMKTADGKTITRDGYGKGKRLMIVYGRTTCPNTRIFMSAVSPYVNILKNSKVTILLALFDDPSAAEMKEMEKLYPGTVCAKLTETDHSMWEGLYALGEDSGSVIFPVVYLKNVNNAITYYSVGYVEEPLRVVSGAIQMKDEAPLRSDPAAGDNAEQEGEEPAKQEDEESSKQEDKEPAEQEDEKPAKQEDKEPAKQENEKAEDSSKGTEPAASPDTETGTGRKETTAASEKSSKVKIGKAVYRLNKKKKTAAFLAPLSKNVKKLTIPATVKSGRIVYKVTEIEKNACKGLKKLNTVIIGTNVKTIGAGAFNGCKSLKKITIKTAKLKASTVKANAFKGIAAKAKIKVPGKKAAAYKKFLKKRGIGKNAVVSR